MSGRASPSPARRPQLNERTSSSASLSKGSPSAGHLSKSHGKGSSTKLHKAHAVGHGRHPHGRVSSHGKGLHKLSKLGPGDVAEGAGHVRHHTRSASHTPTASPTTQNIKRNVSNVSLPRVGSKASMKKNRSEVSLGKNTSSTKLGKQSKGEKAQMKNSLRKKGDVDGPVRGRPNFEVGDEDQEKDDEKDDWTEESNSQSPHTTRHSSIGRRTPQLEDPPSPDEPAEPSLPELPQSPPQSPPNNPSAFVNHAKEQDQHRDRSPYYHPPDANDVTHRLLNRSNHNAAPKTSSVSATVTPNGSSGSPAFIHSQDSTFRNKESMPADGISRFLGGTGSNSGSATPGSVSHLQQSLAHLHHYDRPGSPSDSSSTVKATRKVQSAANLSHPRLSNGDVSSTPSSTAKPLNSKDQVKPPKDTRTSPFESARGADPTKGKSLTQLKLDLQRMSTQRDPPSDQHPLLQHGSGFGIQNLSAGSKEMEARQARQWTQAKVEYANARRFYPDLLVSSFRKPAMQSKLNERKMDGQKKLDGKKAPDGHRGKSFKTAVATSAETAAGRGRVRFEVGKGSPESVEDLEEDGALDGGVEDLLRRMWVQGEASGGEE